MPAQKKHASTRQRRNKAATAATLSAPTEVLIPALPDRKDQFGDVREWLPETVEWWKDEFMNDPTSKNHAEVRIAQQAYGLTPYDRRRLEWTVEQTEDAKERGAQRRRMAQAPQHSPMNDPRLRIVE